MHIHFLEITKLFSCMPVFHHEIFCCSLGECLPGARPARARRAPGALLLY